MVTSPAPANIRVLVRVRPLTVERPIPVQQNKKNVGRFTSKLDFQSNGENKENGMFIDVNGDNIVVTSCGGENNSGNANAQHFMFDAVHGGNSTQSDVYESVKGIVDAIVAGYNGTIVTYGQTGSGKTHTVFGKGVR